ncbi:hypothetical protein [Leptothoe sp. PORK10 BA2]|uniref:hypothetical protein n=1 Tax=Leptothoe sp. PORK10 BA2 TaxID=3110254 RepID=UPI002B21023F|nr:hypothetical protein [Leptothoe sp. PORK10 BA2]MEA5464755.1 hypothetical protein [Leptothoe sp. PORK10 BA2]
MRQIATDLECSPGTVSKALKVLDQKDWIDLEITAAKVKLRTDKLEPDPVEVSDSQYVFPPGNSVLSRKQVFPPDNDRFLEETLVSPRKQLEAETQAQQRVQSALNSLNDLDSLNRERDSQNSIFEIEPDYRDWLLAKASRLPEPPTMRELWLEKQSVNPANLREYEAWQSVQQQIDTLPPPPPPEQPGLEDVDVAARLARYQSQWAVVAMRKGIQNAIATHPEWTIDIGPDGPRWQPPPPEHSSEQPPEPEPDVSTVLHRIKNASSQGEGSANATHSPISSQLQADAERCHIDIPLLQAEWELAVSPPGNAADDMRQAG